MDVRNVKVVARNLKRFVLRVKVPKQIARFHFQETARTAFDFQVFRVVTASTMGRSPFKVTAVTGGVLQRTVQPMHTAANCITASTTLPEATTSTLRRKGFQFVASGIDLTLSSPPEHLRRWSEGCTFS